MTYDLSGNLLNDGTRKYEWDALNRLKKVYKDPNTTPVLIGEYTYDAQGRRIRKVVTNSGLSGTIPNATTDYIYTAWQCLEERDASNVLFKQYVWGIYIDELLKLTTNTTINGNAAGDYYPLQDLLYRTMALTNSSGSIIETYDTDAYGNTLIFTSAGTGSNWYANDATQGDNPTCEHVFTGRRYDAQSANYYFRQRNFAPQLARFLVRDLIHPQSGSSLYLYADAMPTGMLDPMGLESIGAKLANYFRNSSFVRAFGGARSWEFPPIPIPAVPGLSLNLSFTGAIDFARCCEPHGFVASYLDIYGVVEGYGSYGKSFKKIGPGKGRGRNKPIPDPRDNRRTVKRKKVRNHRQGPHGFRDRNAHWTMGSLDNCPKQWGLQVFRDAHVFLRGSMGVGFIGYQANVTKQIDRFFDLSTGYSFDHGLAYGVAGASVELGLAASLRYVIKIDSQQVPCCHEEDPKPVSDAGGSSRYGQVFM